MSDYKMPMFPIMLRSDRWDESTVAVARKAGTPYVAVCLPMEMIEPHEDQARKNHNQSLRELASRGGLSACEALAVLEDRPWRRMDEAKANEALCRAIATWVDDELEEIEQRKLDDAAISGR